jgi:D-serine deaminase-like pyridoxal phosphate-dependent protein
MEWYKIQNTNEIDSPALLIYKERVKQNIIKAISLVKDISLLRPHVKTHKISEVTEMLLAAGITKFKCATIPEAEMLAIAGATDILLAYQPTSVKAERLLSLVQAFPDSHFSCLVDNKQSAQEISEVFHNHSIEVYIDLNVGMNRTGIKPEEAMELFMYCHSIKNILIKGLHVYDGSTSDAGTSLYRERCSKMYQSVLSVKEKIEAIDARKLRIIMSGTPAFPIFCQDTNVETSPGTFVFWDEGYRTTMPQLDFTIAAVVITRVISKIDQETLCLDLGHKSVASENPIHSRVIFLNQPNAVPVRHSEEHLVVQVPDTSEHQIGDVWYGVPYHICPTVALYETAYVINEHMYSEKWEVIARNRVITF